MPLKLGKFRAAGYRSCIPARATLGARAGPDGFPRLAQCGPFQARIRGVGDHSERLASAIMEHADVAPLTVVRRDGETWIDGLKITGEFRDEDDDA
jgi:hypothetical protein